MAWQLLTQAGKRRSCDGVNIAMQPAQQGCGAEQLQATCWHSPTSHSEVHNIALLSRQYGAPAVAVQEEGLPFHSGDPSTLETTAQFKWVCNAAHQCGPQLRALGSRTFRNTGAVLGQCSCSEQISRIRRLAELAVSKQQPLYLAFVDLLSAFNGSNRDALWLRQLLQGLA
ncbi:hypothetical protein N2152v2_009455 [Parachlorella kessleri]